MGADQVGHDRAVDHAQPLGAEDAQVRIDHRQGIGGEAHSAGAERVVDGDGIRSDMGVEIGVGHRAVARRNLPGHERLHRRLAADVAHHAQARAKRLAVVVGGEKILADAHRLSRIGGDQLDPAAAFRAQHHGAAGIAVGVGRPKRPEIRCRRHRRGIEDQLDVGQRHIGPAFQERHLAGRQFGGNALAAPIGVGQRRHDAVEAHRPVQGARAFTPIGHARRNVVLQILADARQRHLHGDIVGAQFVRIADARKQQQLWRVDDAAAQNHFALGLRRHHLAVLQIFDARCALAIEDKPRHQGIDFNVEIVARQRRPQIGVGGAAAAAVAHRHLPDAKTFLLGAVVIGRGLVARGKPRRGEGIDQRIGKPRHLRRQRTVAAAIKARAALPGFLAPEIRQHMSIRPRREPGGGPAIVIAAMAARIGHGVDRRRAADDAAAGAFEAAPAGRRLGLGEIHPIVLALQQQARPAERDLDPRIAIPAAGFDQQHPLALVLAQPVGQHATGRSGADDDGVVTALAGHGAYLIRRRDSGGGAMTT